MGGPGGMGPGGGMGGGMPPHGGAGGPYGGPAFGGAPPQGPPGGMQVTSHPSCLPRSPHSRVLTRATPHTVNDPSCPVASRPHGVGDRASVASKSVVFSARHSTRTNLCFVMAFAGVTTTI
jgi:hypothetical protein